jgi:hypothetical protein
VDAAPQQRPWIVRFLRRAWPWLVGAVILVIVATRVPVEAFKSAMTKGPHLTLALVNIAINVAVLGSDSVSTWVGLIGLRMRRPFTKVLVVRGATYALFVVNYAVGQGGFGYYLHRTGETALRAVGATLFLIGTNLATLILVTLAAWSIYGGQSDSPEMWWTIVAASIGFALYLVLIALSPGPLARRQIFAPLFEAGLRGHAIAVAGRLPHILVIVLGHWVAMRAWGIEVPFVAGITIMPAVVIASVLPISPAGLGTTQAAFVFFFASYAAGATSDERTAHVLAFAMVHFVYGVMASLAVGLACLPFAKRTRAIESGPT